MPLALHRMSGVQEQVLNHDFQQLRRRR
jgi:hypothetical protein